MSNDEGPGDLRSLYVSASTKKAALTRARKALELSIGALSGTPASDHFFQQLKQNLEKYRLLRDEVLDIYDHIRFQVAEDKFTKDFGKQEKEIETDYERVEEASTRAIAGHQASLTASTSSAAQTGGARGLPAPEARAPPWKIQTMFQPKDSLKLDSTVGEFHNWKREFNNFYELSKLQNAEIGIQRAGLSNCLDPDFLNKISEALTAITNKEEGLQVIEKEFKKRHPILIRRHSLFCLDQDKDESRFSDTVARMKTLAKDCNLVDMSRDQILCHILIKACSQDDKLRSKLLEVDADTMTLDQLVDIVERYEVIQITNKGLGKQEKAFGRRARGKEKGGGKEGGGGGRICYRCQEVGKHIAANCPVEEESLFCRYCSKAKAGPPFKHNTFEECKNNPANSEGGEKKEGEKDAKKGDGDSSIKGRRVQVRDLSPAGKPESSDDEDGYDGFVRRVKADDPKSDSEGWDSEDDDGFSSNYETDDGDRDEGEISEDVWHSELETVPLKIRGKALHVEESGNLTPAPGRTAVNNSGSSAGGVESTSFKPKRPLWISAGTWFASAWASWRGQKKEEKEKDKMT